MPVIRLRPIPEDAKLNGLSSDCFASLPEFYPKKADYCKSERGLIYYDAAALGVTDRFFKRSSFCFFNAFSISYGFKSDLSYDFCLGVLPEVVYAV